MDWDRAVWLPLDESDLDAYEGALIRRLTPRYNTSAPSDAARDAEICELLGLPPCDLARLAEYLDRRRQSYAVPGVRRAKWNKRQKAQARREREL
jgi:hypothetical protein